MLSTCWGRSTKFLKKKGTASNSGGKDKVGGTAFSRFHRKVWRASSSGDVVYEGMIISWPWLGEDDVRDLDRYGLVLGEDSKVELGERLFYVSDGFLK